MRTVQGNLLVSSLILVSVFSDYVVFMHGDVQSTVSVTSSLIIIILTGMTRTCHDNVTLLFITLGRANSTAIYEANNRVQLRRNAVRTHHQVADKTVVDETCRGLCVPVT